jgi:hypothetical protein
MPVIAYYRRLSLAPLSSASFLLASYHVFIRILLPAAPLP